MKFSIVTPLLDGRQMFTACAASVHAQRESAPELKIRHIVRESAASASHCEDIANAFGCDYVRAPDSGIYDAIAAGLNAAVDNEADILCWLNADEQLLPDAINHVTAAFSAHPELDIVFGDYLIISPEGTVLSARREMPARRFLLRNGVNYILSCTTFFRRSLWTHLRPFSADYQLLADKQFYLRAMDSGATFQHIPAYLATYGATGRNASLHPHARDEQARLRNEIGVSKHACTRTVARILRGTEKLFRGAYFPAHVETTVFNAEGQPLTFRGRVGTAWRWQ